MNKQKKAFLSTKRFEKKFFIKKLMGIFLLAFIIMGDGFSSHALIIKGDSFEQDESCHKEINILIDQWRSITDDIFQADSALEDTNYFQITVLVGLEYCSLGFNSSPNNLWKSLFNSSCEEIITKAKKQEDISYFTIRNLIWLSRLADEREKRQSWTSLENYNSLLEESFGKTLLFAFLLESGFPFWGLLNKAESRGDVRLFPNELTRLLDLVHIAKSLYTEKEVRITERQDSLIMDLSLDLKKCGERRDFICEDVFLPSGKYFILNHEQFLYAVDLAGLHLKNSSAHYQNCSEI